MTRLAESPKEGDISKRAVLPMMILMATAAGASAKRSFSI
jgi:hypothetical protein